MKAVNATSAATPKIALVQVKAPLALVSADKAPASVAASKVATPKQDYSAMSDVELVVACQAKDQQAMTALLKRYERPIMVMIRRVGPDLKDPQDILQEVYIRIWRSIDNLRNPYSFRKWVNQIITRLYYDELRKKVNQYQLVSMDEPILGDSENESTTRDIIDSAPQPDARLLNKELSTKLEEAMASISEPFRVAAVLRDVDGLSYEEIASLTSTELGTVKSRIARARMKIQKRLNPYLSEAA
ncbi:MAG: sigma-70 family RNA polymerase sigma factor [Cyanobacteria bacterium REEB67]|nr:sigma-70 family RNA polymerase sigma factor [Cyanobacteria bacterium REEB67]